MGSAMFNGKRKCRCQAIIIQDDSILFLKHQGKITSQPYWMLPGGALMEDETITDGILRELEEEICATVNIVKLVQSDVLDTEYYEFATFLCTLNHGCQIKPGEERHSIISKFEWIPICDILSGQVENKIKQVEPDIHSIIRNLV